MKYRILFFSVPFLCLINHVLADPIISFFMRHYPDQEYYLKQVKKPWRQTSQMHSQLNLQPLSGLYASYGGMIQVSDLHGEITFPRKHTGNSLYLVITTEIIPITMFYNTVHHWEINPKLPATIYQLEQKKDKETNITYWEVSISSLPVNNILPIESIVIFAKPTNIYLPVGVYATSESSNLMLPDIYVKKGINVVENSLYVTALGHFFASVKKEIGKKEPKYYNFKVH